jgi:hypothetical protein
LITPPNHKTDQQRQRLPGMLAEWERVALDFAPKLAENAPEILMELVRQNRLATILPWEGK